MNEQFQRSGLASLDDLDSQEWRVLFKSLETMQETFLAKQHLFRSGDYPWPIDALHWWSRVWEYPYVLMQLQGFLRDSRTRPRIADLGSGVTFFPFAVASQGADVIAFDVDPLVQRDLTRAVEVFDATPGSVSAKLAEDSVLPIASQSLDAVYCISVLEHVVDTSATINEISRVLRPNGLFVLTFDIDLAGSFDLGPSKFARVMSTLRENFVLIRPETTIHPSRVLDSRNSPFPLYPSPRGPLGRARSAAGRFVRRSLGTQGMHLACAGFSFRRP